MPNPVILPEQLGAMQRKFTAMVGQLIAWAYANKYELTFGEAYRTPEQCAVDVQKGTGILHSLHAERLAVDLNLFEGGVYQQNSHAYEPLGIYWESLGGSWGGRFQSNPDGNHFSLEYEGRK
jgi:hypothetical protein